jgi:hypothetical protein
MNSSLGATGYATALFTLAEPVAPEQLLKSLF